MSDLVSWLAARRPEPPEALAGDVERSLVGHPGSGDVEPGAPPKGSVDMLLERACARLAEARARPGRVRESAFHLLAADALVTYACEAALEDDDPEAALLRIAEVVAAP